MRRPLCGPGPHERVRSQERFRRRNSCETVNSFPPANLLNSRDSGFRYRPGAVNSFRRISARREGFPPSATAARSTASGREGRGSWGISGRDAKPEKGSGGQGGGGKETRVQPSLCRRRNVRRRVCWKDGWAEGTGSEQRPLEIKLLASSPLSSVQPPPIVDAGRRISASLPAGDCNFELSPSSRPFRTRTPRLRRWTKAAARSLRSRA